MQIGSLVPNITCFQRDALAIAGAMREEPEILHRTIVMVLLSIRQPWYKVPEQFADVMKRGADSKYLFGFKRDGYEKSRQYEKIIHKMIFENPDDLDFVILTLMKIPGLGLAKASFVAQMAVGDGACLDSHNLRRIGLTADFTRLNKNANGAIIKSKIETYNEAWKTYGDSEFWWNSWCEALAQRSPTKFESASAVSTIHRLPLYDWYVK